MCSLAVLAVAISSRLSLRGCVICITATASREQLPVSPWQALYQVSCLDCQMRVYFALNNAPPLSAVFVLMRVCHSILHVALLNMLDEAALIIAG
jgi:hypothetical protein